MNDQVLEVVFVSEERESIDNRLFRTIGVVPADQAESGVINPTNMHKRNIWNRAPLGGPEHPYYEKIKEGSKILGNIVTIPTKEYYIPNTRGKFVDEKGDHFNRVKYKTYVVFPDETAENARKNDGLDPNQSPEESAQYPSSLTVDVIGEMKIDPNVGGPSPERDKKDLPEEELVAEG